MKFQVFVNPKRPKIPVEKIVGRIQNAGLSYSRSDADIAIVVGGDGTFGYYGRTLDIPMLFVGVEESNVLGSKAMLARAMYNYDFEKTLHNINSGSYNVLEKSKICVNVNGEYQSDVLTDIYLERGEFSGCIRYVTFVSNIDNSSKRSNNSLLPFKEYAIGNGIIVSTSFGSTGYFSYPDWFSSKKKMKQREGRNSNKNNYNNLRFSDKRIGLCHIIPTFLLREQYKKQNVTYKAQYTIPNSSKIRIKLIRNANCRLYGTSRDSRGIPISIKDKITICQSENKAKIVAPIPPLQ